MKIDGKTTGTWDGIITIFSGYDETAKMKRFIHIADGTDDDKFITLDDCLELIGYDGTDTVTVIFEDYLHGEIYNFGNYGKHWEQVGETQGYA